MTVSFVIFSSLLNAILSSIDFHTLRMYNKSKHNCLPGNEARTKRLRKRYDQVHGASPSIPIPMIATFTASCAKSIYRLAPSRANALQREDLNDAWISRLLAGYWKSQGEHLYEKLFPLLWANRWSINTWMRLSTCVASME